MEKKTLTRQKFIHKMIEMLKTLNKINALDNPNVENEIKKQIESIEGQKKQEKLKEKNNMIIKEFDFYEVAIQNIIESTKDLTLFFQKKIIIEVCEKCNQRKIKTENTNILSSFDTNRRLGNEYNLDEFFAINKVKINCRKCDSISSVKAETIFIQIPEYLIILFKNNGKKINYPEINFSFEYLDYNIDNNNFSYINKRSSYNLKAVMIKEISDFFNILVKLFVYHRRMLIKEKYLYHLLKCMCSPDRNYTFILT